MRESPVRAVGEQRDHVVRPPAVAGRGELVHGRAGQRVPEADGPPTEVDVHQPGTLRDLQGVVDRRGEQRGDVVAEGDEQERPPGPGGHSPDARREPLPQEPARRDDGRSRTGDEALGPRRPCGQLPQRPRVPCGPGHHAVDEVGGQSGDVLPDQPRGVGVPQRRDREPGEPGRHGATVPAGRRGSAVPGRRRGATVAGVRGGEEAHPAACQPAGDEGQRGRALAVEVLQVVDHDQERPPSPGSPQDGERPGPDQQPVRLRAAGPGGRAQGLPPGAVESVHLGSERPQEDGESAEGDAGPGPITTGPQHRGVAVARAAGRRVEQRGPARAGVAGEDQGAAACRRLVEERTDGRELGRPSDEGPRRGRTWW